VEIDAAGLVGWRIGKRQRAILLAATIEDLTVIPTAGDGRAVAEAHKRAMHVLADKQLLQLGHLGVKVKAHDPRLDRKYWDGSYMYKESYRERGRPTRVYKLAARLTPLGAAVVALLKMGEPLRWERDRAALVAGCRLGPEKLLQDFRERLDKLEGFLGWRVGILGLLRKPVDADLKAQIELVAHVKRAIDKPSQTVDEYVNSGMKCPRCEKPVMQTFNPGGAVSLCNGCWGELGAEWAARRSSARS